MFLLLFSGFLFLVYFDKQTLCVFRGDADEEYEDDEEDEQKEGNTENDDDNTIGDNNGGRTNKVGLLFSLLVHCLTDYNILYTLLAVVTGCYGFLLLVRAVYTIYSHDLRSTKLMFFC